ncbi:MAG TPA: hypothetical protein VFU02_22825, partial [Polyangiaceae bacterium]|nr:hypothetical protein [Polyangiaceae bacterium]
MSSNRKHGWKRGLAFAALCVALPQSTRATPSHPERVLDAIVELDVARARELLDAHSDSPALPLERARLALYNGDCEGAQAVLAGASAASVREGADLLAVAAACAGATAGALIVKDDKAGVHVRLQDGRDEPLVPFIIDVSERARAAMQRDL